MTRTLLLAFLLIPLTGFSQTLKPINGVLGLKFGSSKIAITAALKAKGGIINNTIKNPNSMIFKNLKYGHRSPNIVIVKFVHDKAFEFDLVFKPIVDANILMTTIV